MKRFAAFALLLFLCLPAPVRAGESSSEPILIGGLFAESGPAAFIGTPTRLVAEMTIKDVNAKGGVNGRQLKLISYDTESDPNIAQRMARQLVEADKVLAIIGPSTTGEGLAVKKYTEENKIPTIMTVGGDPVIAGGKFGPFVWTFKTPQRTSTAAEKVYAYLRDNKVSKIAVLSAKDAFGQDGLEHLKKLAPNFGIEIVAEESLDPSGTDFSAQMFKLLEAKPQAVVVWTIGPAGAVAAKNFAALPGAKPLLVQCHGQPSPKYLELAGPAAEGTLMPGTKLMAAGQLPDSDVQKPVVLRFIQMYGDQGLEKKFPLNTHSGYAFDALTLLRAGLEKAGKADRESLRAALESLKGIVGVSGVFNITPEDHNGLSVDSLVMLKVEGGAFKLAK
jgi:branched-chain amino acid transport system substrate-binding protein